MIIYNILHSFTHECHEVIIQPFVLTVIWLNKLLKYHNTRIVNKVKYTGKPLLPISQIFFGWFIKSDTWNLPENKSTPPENKPCYL